jgi:hypothetical protein
VDLFDVVRSCFRRWYVVLPLLLITAWFSHHVYASVKPVYYSSAVVGLAPPNTQMQFSNDGLPVPRNGLLDVGGATLVTNMTVFGLQDPAVRAQVVAGGGKSDFVVRMFPSPVAGNGQEQLPLVMIEAEEVDPISAGKTVELVAAQTDSVLRNLQQQAGVPDDQMAKGLMVSPPSVPLAAVPSRTRSALYLAVVGAAISILIGVVVDVFLMRRRAKVRVRAQTANDGDATKHAKNSSSHNANVAAETALDSR